MLAAFQNSVSHCTVSRLLSSSFSFLQWRQQQYVGMITEGRKRISKLADAVLVARATVDFFNQRVQTSEERQYSAALGIWDFCNTLDAANARSAASAKRLARDRKTLVAAVRTLQRRHETLMREALRGEDVEAGEDLWTHLEKAASGLDKDCCECAVLLQRAKRQLATDRTAVELLREQTGARNLPPASNVPTPALLLLPLLLLLLASAFGTMLLLRHKSAAQSCLSRPRTNRCFPSNAPLNPQDQARPCPQVQLDSLSTADLQARSQNQARAPSPLPPSSLLLPFPLPLNPSPHLASPRVRRQTLAEEADHLQAWLRDILGAATWLQQQRRYLGALHEQLGVCREKPDEVRTRESGKNRKAAK